MWSMKFKYFNYIFGSYLKCNLASLQTVIFFESGCHFFSVVYSKALIIPCTFLL
jgi:hypothetical protein